MDICSYTIAKFTAKGLVTCLNPEARNSRLFWLTQSGQECQKRLYQESYPEKTAELYDFPSVDWELYGWVCYSHRGAIIRILTEPMQPSAMKRTLRKYPALKISANNVRDVIRLFLGKGIVRLVKVHKKAHPRYELTEAGEQFRKLLMGAEKWC